MQGEAKQEIERDRAKFEDLVFANNPKLYDVLFGVPTVSDAEVESEDFEWIVPESEEEVKELMAKLEETMAELP